MPTDKDGRSTAAAKLNSGFNWMEAEPQWVVNALGKPIWFDVLAFIYIYCLVTAGTQIALGGNKQFLLFCVSVCTSPQINDHSRLLIMCAQVHYR